MRASEVEDNQVGHLRGGGDELGGLASNLAVLGLEGCGEGSREAPLLLGYLEEAAIVGGLTLGSVLNNTANNGVKSVGQIHNNIRREVGRATASAGPHRLLGQALGVPHWE